MRKHGWEWIALFAALGLLVAITLMRSSGGIAVSYPSTYDTGLNGYAALYDFLARENVQPSRFEVPPTQLAARSTLVVAGNHALDPSVFAPRRSSRPVEPWIRNGGRLIVLGEMYAGTRSALGLPPAHFSKNTFATRGCGYHAGTRTVTADFATVIRTACSQRTAVLLQTRGGAVALAVRHGRGTIVEVVTPSIFDNLHLLRRDNAAFAYDVFSAGPPPQFDERIYGYERERGFWQVLPQPVHVAIFVAIAALLLAIVGANLPFAPAKQLDRETVRDSAEYITSLARLLQRGSAPHEIVSRLAKAAAGFRPPAANDDRARKLLAELRELAYRQDAGGRDVLRAGTIFAQLRKDYG